MEPPANCPLCNNKVKLMQINAEEAIKMCVNTQCVYPIGCPNVKMEYVPRNFKDAVQQCEVQEVTPVENDDPVLDFDFNQIDDTFFNTLINSPDEENQEQENVEELEKLLEELSNTPNS